MAAKGTGSLVFIDDVTAKKNSQRNSEVFRAKLSAGRQCFSVMKQYKSMVNQDN